MHQSVLDWVARVATPERIAGKSVLEVGSQNINGSVRPTIEARGPKSYFGIDLMPGPGVDETISVEGWRARCLALPAYDVVISAEMLEHAQDWAAAFQACCALARETLILTARGPGFPYHNPPDYWRFTTGDMLAATIASGFEALEILRDPQVPGVFLLAQRVAMPTPARAPAPGRAF